MLPSDEMLTRFSNFSRVRAYSSCIKDFKINLFFLPWSHRDFLYIVEIQFRSIGGQHQCMPVWVRWLLLEPVVVEKNTKDRISKAQTFGWLAYSSWHCFGLAGIGPGKRNEVWSPPWTRRLSQIITPRIKNFPTTIRNPSMTSPKSRAAFTRKRDLAVVILLSKSGTASSHGSPTLVSSSVVASEGGIMISDTKLDNGRSILWKLLNE